MEGLLPHLFSTIDCCKQSLINRLGHAGGTEFEIVSCLMINLSNFEIEAINL